MLAEVLNVEEYFIAVGDVTVEDIAIVQEPLEVLKVVIFVRVRTIIVLNKLAEHKKLVVAKYSRARLVAKDYFTLLVRILY